MEAIKHNELKEQYAVFKAENPNVRIRDAAKQLNVSEMELLSASPEISVIQLKEDWGDILLELKNLGRVMALTRNESVVHERKGVYNKAEVMGVHGAMALVLDEEIDLRIFFSNWAFGFAVNEKKDGGERHSLHFFDKSGVAVHKIYLTEKSNTDAFFDLINQYKKDTPDAHFVLQPSEDKRFHNNDEDIEVEGFLKAWDAMTDTHQFFGMLKKHKVDRMQALRLAGKQRAFRLAKDEIEKMLHHAAQEQMEIMVFVSNPGMVQIHTGTVNTIKVLGNWLNVLDPEFNLHINTLGIVHVWLVKKPTEDGQVSSIECYDKDENLVVQFFGKRKPGIPEASDWRACVESLEAL